MGVGGMMGGSVGTGGSNAVGTVKRTIVRGGVVRGGFHVVAGPVSWIGVGWIEGVLPMRRQQLCTFVRGSIRWKDGAVVGWRACRHVLVRWQGSTLVGVVGWPPHSVTLDILFVEILFAFLFGMCPQMMDTCPRKPSFRVAPVPFH